MPGIKPGMTRRDRNSTLKIGILLGDDIGLEVVPESVKVMKAAAAQPRLAIELHERPIGQARPEHPGARR